MSLIFVDSFENYSGDQFKELWKPMTAPGAGSHPVKSDNALILASREAITLEEHVNAWQRHGSQKFTQADLLLRDAVKQGNLWLPSIFPSKNYYTIQWPVAHGSMNTWAYFSPKPKPEQPPEEPKFEVDLVEPLVGWKSLIFNNELLESSYSYFEWQHLVPAIAKCNDCMDSGQHQPPAVHGTCGIYAVDKREDVPIDSGDDSEVMCEVYGWGRYVRGDQGWRAGKAYLKAIYLRSNQWAMVEKLKAYGVPITLDIPTPVYDPQEDGYEHG